jgi:4-hydroxybenzoate polyprenyltransferase
MDTRSETPIGKIALVIDLDGTLLRSDLLLESLFALLRRHPLLVFALPLWLLKGKAAFKAEIAHRVDLDMAGMPWDERVRELLHGAAGRRHRVLCTASDQSLAFAAATHIGQFDEVLSSDGVRNLSGRRKAALLVDRFGERGFDYAGNAEVDLHVWRVAREAIVVNAPMSLANAAARCTRVSQHLPAPDAGVAAWLRALRVHQWLKNVLVFVPLLASHRMFEPMAASQAAVAFMAFSLCASGVYLLNDLLDLASDRQHPRKRMRPFAAGALPLLHGMLAVPVLTAFAFALALWVSPLFAAALGLYLLLTLAYSLYLKRIVMMDVMVLAALYTLRIVAGTLAIGAALSFWLLAFSMFLFLSLAMLKRYTELLTLQSRGDAQSAGRDYRVDDLPLVQSLGAASGYLAVLVLALYINSTASELLYRHPQLLWLLCPVLLYWIGRAWMIAHRSLMRDDPVVFAATDRASQLLVAVSALIVVGAI